MRSSDGRPQFADFELQRRLGGGAVAEVWLARQVSLDRLVALKFPRATVVERARIHGLLLQEARTLARIAHPGVISLLGLGEEAQGPYLVLEHIDGADLGALLEAAGSRASGGALTEFEAAGGIGAAALEGDWFHAVARIVRQVADAVDHLHRRGFLHRDIHAGNVLVERSGRAVLCDLGLGGESGSPGARAEGTLAALAPELIEGQQSTRATDVYALGALLLLALSPRTNEARERAATRTLEGRAVPRSCAAGRVPWALRTIVQKALEVDPSRRYSSAGDLARDLACFIEGRPIAARPAPLGVRLARWRTRRPASAALACIAIPVAFVTPTWLAWRDARHAEALEAASRRAALQLELAVEAVDGMLVDVGRRGLYGHPLVDDKRARILRDAVVSLEAVLESERSDLSEARGTVEGIELALIDARTALASALRESGRLREASTQLERALVGPRPVEPRARLATAHAEFELALVRHIQGRFDEARRFLDAALEAVAPLTATNERAETLRLYANLLSIELWLEGGELDAAAQAAEAAHDSSLALLEQTSGESSIALIQRELARVLTSWSAVEIERRDFSSALARVNGAAIALDRASDDLVAFETRGILLHNRGAAADALGQPKLAQDSFDEALRVQRRLVEAFPSSPARRLMHARTAYAFGVALVGVEDARARSLIDEALGQLMRPPEGTPAAARWNLVLVDCLTKRSWLASRSGDFAASERALAEALALTGAAVRERPDRRSAQELDRRVWSTRALNAARFLRDLDLALPIVRDGLQRYPDDPVVARSVAALLTICGALAELEGGPDGARRRAELESEALDALELAVRLGYSDVEDLDNARPLSRLRVHERFTSIRSAAVEAASRRPR